MDIFTTKKILSGLSGFYVSGSGSGPKKTFYVLGLFFRVRVFKKIFMSPGSGSEKNFYVLGLFFPGFGALYPTQPDPVPVIH